MKKKIKQKGAKSAKVAATSKQEAAVVAGDMPPIIERVKMARVIDVPLRTIKVGTTNPRKRFELENLKKSIQQVGIVSALWVRPLPEYKLHEPELGNATYRIMKNCKGEPNCGAAPWLVVSVYDANKEEMAREKFKELTAFQYELIAGERRYRSAGELKLAEVPVKVIACSDDEAWELQQIENLQREDLTVLEEAEGFRDIVDRKIYGDTVGASVEVICEKLQKSRSYVFGRLSLLKLGEEGKKALSEGTMDAHVAQLVASVPPALQPELMREIKTQGYGGEPMSFRQAKAHIDRDYKANLKEAPFSIKDAELDPKAGACKGCPNYQAPNICLDVACFANKKEMAYQAREKAAREEGRKIMSGKEWESVRHGDRFICLDSECYQVEGADRAWRELVKGQPIQPILTRDYNGELIEVLPKEQAMEAAKRNKVKFHSYSNGAEEKERREEQKANKEKRTVMGIALAEVLKQIEAKAHNTDDAGGLWRVVGLMALNHLAEGQTHEREHLAAARGIILDADDYDHREKQLPEALEMAAKNGERGARAFAVQALAVNGWMNHYNPAWGENMELICKHFGIDLAGIEKEVVKARAKAKEKPQKELGLSGEQKLEKLGLLTKKG